ncbi:hypothetical protein SPHINGOAX6_20244 [Sphingomonas sp. AX6]|nr:hypothetical protein SPHINGOAX6_20244 [Sphingomonas sp. AX6]
MASPALDRFGVQHPGTLAEAGFEFSVVDTGIAAGDDQLHGVAAFKRNRLGDPRGLHTQRLGSLGDGCSACTLVDKNNVRGSCLQERPDAVDTHAKDLAVQLVLDRLGGAEAQLLRCGDLNGRAGRGVAAFAGRAVLDLELAEAVQRHFFALRGGIGDRRENGIDDLAGVGFGQAMIVGNNVGEIGIIHLDILL